MKITKDTKIGEIVDKHPETIEILLKSGLHCIGCPARGMESLEQGCKGHGLDDEKIEALVKEINKAIENKE